MSEISDREIDLRFFLFTGKRVGVLYSGGFDSSWLAWHLAKTFGADVTLLLYDCGAENDPHDASFDPSKPIDYVKDIDQYQRYAGFMTDRFDKPLKTIVIPTLNLGALTVKPEFLRAADNEAAEHDEREYGLTFYAGFVMLRLTAALSIAAAQGLDYIVTGHMGWNGHYRDESLQFAEDLTGLFDDYYSSRLKKVPQISMPFRDLNLTKSDLIGYNDRSKQPMDPRDTISCNVSVLRSVKGTTVRGRDDEIFTAFYLKDGRQIHCGKCQHCIDRKAMFEEVGVEDTAYYA